MHHGYLVDIIGVYSGVEASVQVVKEVDHLEWRRVRRDGREANDVREVDRHFPEVLWVHRHTKLQFVGHRTGNEIARVISEAVRMENM